MLTKYTVEKYSPKSVGMHRFFQVNIKLVAIIKNMGIHGSITGKMITRIICFDYITTATTPLPNQ